MVTRTGGNDPIERITAGSFIGYLVDAGVVTSSPGFTPTSVDRSANGGVVGFNYQNAANLTDNQSTQLLVIQTNATSFAAGVMSVQDGLAANGIGFQPASTPEPISMSLLGGGLALIGFGRWPRNQKRANKTVRVSSNSLGNLVLPRLFLFLEFAESFRQGEGPFLRKQILGRTGSAYPTTLPYPSKVQKL